MPRGSDGAAGGETTARDLLLSSFLPLSCTGWSTVVALAAESETYLLCLVSFTTLAILLWATGDDEVEVTWDTEVLRPTFSSRVLEEEEEDGDEFISQALKDVEEWLSLADLLPKPGLFCSYFGFPMVVVLKLGEALLYPPCEGKLDCWGVMSKSPIGEDLEGEEIKNDLRESGDLKGEDVPFDPGVKEDEEEEGGKKPRRGVWGGLFNSSPPVDTVTPSTTAEDI
jgi:hypothetical protein